MVEASRQDSLKEPEVTIVIGASAPRRRLSAVSTRWRPAEPGVRSSSWRRIAAATRCGRVFRGGISERPARSCQLWRDGIAASRGRIVA
jgi:hypothetical protein